MTAMSVSGQRHMMRSMGQGIGGGVRKAEGGPNWYDLYSEPLLEKSKADLPF